MCKLISSCFHSHFLLVAPPLIYLCINTFSHCGGAIVEMVSDYCPVVLKFIVVSFAYSSYLTIVFLIYFYQFLIHSLQKYGNQQISFVSYNSWTFLMATVSSCSFSLTETLFYNFKTLFLLCFPYAYMDHAVIVIWVQPQIQIFTAISKSSNLVESCIVSFPVKAHWAQISFSLGARCVCIAILMHWYLNWNYFIELLSISQFI